MNEAFAQILAAFELGLRLCLPALLAALGAALAVALLQRLTRMGEPALNAIPRALVTLWVLGSSAGYLGRELVTYTGALYRALPELVR